MKIIGIGLTGLVGTRITALLPHYDFEILSRSTGYDITNFDHIAQAIMSSKASIVIHAAAKTNVDGCEEDKQFGMQGEAWKLNVESTRVITKACMQSGKKIIYISTDFVFDGTKQMYQEDDIPHPLNWYGETKYQGENIIRSTPLEWVIARIAYPYGYGDKKIDFVHAIANRLRNNQETQVVTDHIFTPTFIDDIAFALDKIIALHQKGIFHIVGDTSLTPLEAAISIAHYGGYNKKLIIPTTREQYFAGKAMRPFQLSLRNDKIKQLKLSMSSFSQGLGKIKTTL